MIVILHLVALFGYIGGQVLPTSLDALDNSGCDFTDPEGVSLVEGSDGACLTTDWEDGISNIVASTPLCKPTMKRAACKYSKSSHTAYDSSDTEDPAGISLEYGPGCRSTEIVRGEINKEIELQKTQVQSYFHANSSDAEDPAGISLEYGPGYVSTDEEIISHAKHHTTQSQTNLCASEINGSARMKEKALQIETISQARKMKCLCRNSCNKLFNFEEIYNLRKKYWTFPRSMKLSFLINYIRNSRYHGKRRIYKINGKEICTQSFLNIFRINKNSLSYAISLRNKNMESSCGKKPRKISEHSVNAMNFIDWFSKYYGDKMPHTNEILIPYKTSKTMVYEQYCKRPATGTAVSISQFLHIWKRRFKNVKIRKTNTFSKCSMCTGFERELEKTTDSLTRSRLQQSRHEHLDRQMLERAYYYSKREASENDPENIMSIIIDGMDQSKTSLPHFAGRLPKFINVADLMKSHITGVLNHGQQKFHTFVDFNQYSHDPNLTINVILKILRWTSMKQGNKLPRILYVQADNCFRENRNKAVLSFLELLTRENIFNEVHLSFLMVGHTHEDVDAGFSRISEQLRKKDAETIPDLISTIQSVNQKYTAEELNDMLDVKQFLLPHTNNVQLVSQPLHFKFVKSLSGVNVFSKALHNDEWIRHEHSFLNSVPLGKPAILYKNLEKLDPDHLKKMIDTVKHYFKKDISNEWWKNFCDKLKENVNFEVKWLDDLPRQTIPIEPPLPDHLQELIGKETEKRTMIIRKRRVIAEVNKDKTKSKKSQPDKTPKSKKGKRCTLVHRTRTNVTVQFDGDVKKHIWLKIFFDICLFLLTFLSVLNVCILIINLFMIMISIYDILDKLNMLFETLLSVHMCSSKALVNVQSYIESIGEDNFCKMKSLCLTRKRDWSHGNFNFYYLNLPNN